MGGGFNEVRLYMHHVIATVGYGLLVCTVPYSFTMFRFWEIAAGNTVQNILSVDVSLQSLNTFVFMFFCSYSRWIKVHD